MTSAMVKAVESVSKVLASFLSDPKIMGTGPIIMTPAVLVFPFLLCRIIIIVAVTATMNTPNTISKNPKAKSPVSAIVFGFPIV